MKSKDIYTEKLKIQKKKIAIPKNKSTNINGKEYSFADLESVLKAIKPTLNKHNILLTHSFSGDTIATTLYHVPSGTSDTSSLNLSAFGQNLHKLGASITYIRRYMIISMLGLVAEDDFDGVIGTQENRPNGFSSDIQKAFTMIDGCATVQALELVSYQVKNSEKFNQEEKSYLAGVIQRKEHELDGTIQRD